MWKKQLMALNLALLLLGLTAVPAVAAGQVDEAIPYVPPEDEAMEADLPLPDLSTVPDWADGGDLSLQDTSDSPYLISVDGTSFWSNQDTTGNQWSYRAEDHALTLTGYYGGSIRASGDLTVYTQNTVNITGADGSSYGSDGVAVDGTLMLIVLSGSVHISGGDGSVRGGDAIHANEFNYGNLIGTSAYFYGGDATSTVYADEPFGGCGIRAGFIMLLGTGRVYSYGGDVSYSSTAKAMGGYGILTDTIYIESDCTIRGGNGYFCGPGICFLSYCQFGVVNASIICPGSVGYAIFNPEERTWYVSPHTTVGGTSLMRTITINQYRLNLYSNAGSSATLPNGATWTSLQEYYPASYDLMDYIFQRPGYVQLAWTGSGYSASDPLPLNTVFTPATNCSLYAYWTAANPGDIILNALDGRLSDGSFYQRITGPSAALPAQVSYEDEASSLLGWCSLPTSVGTENYLLSGQWYEGGDVMPSDPDQVTQLYAQENYYGSYAIYHPGAGAPVNGGNILVQGTRGNPSSPTDLYAYTLNSAQLTAPEGYTLAGWATAENSSQIAYQPGEEIHVPQNSVQHLYAVWQPTEYTYTPAPGLTVISVPLTKTIRVEISDSWAGSTAYTALCALYEGDKIVDCALSSTGSGTLELQYPGDTPPLCKVFALNENRQPLRACTSYTPDK